MAKNSFSIKFGPLLFNKESISYIIFGFFLVGLLAGLFSIIHIDNPGTPSGGTLTIFLTMVIPIVIITKGIRKAEVVD